MPGLTDTRVAAIKAPEKGQMEYPDNRVTGLRLRVGSTGRKTWILRGRDGEKIFNRKLGVYPRMSLADAREAGNKLRDALEDGRGMAALNRTFGEVAEAWIEKVAKPLNDSWKLQQRRLEMHVYPAWKDRRITEIRRSDVRDLLDAIEGDVLPNRVLTSIKTVFRYALSRDWIEASPVEGIKKPMQETERDRVLDMNEVAAVWRSATLLGYPAGPFVHTLLLTGQRRSEVAAMRWDALDLGAGTWTLSSTETKASRAHVVPLTASLVSLIDGLPRFGPFVFSSDGETHISNYAKLKTRLDAFADALKQPVREWTLHDLRRSAATHMVRLGVSEEVVGRVLNHAPKGVTAKVYALHSYMPEKRSALDRWAAEVERELVRDSGENVVSLHG